MSFRDTLEKNKAMFTGIAAGVTVLAIVWLLYGVMSGGAPEAVVPTKYYFSTDNGVTFFADDMKKIPPFDSGGKVAVKAHIFSCDGGKTKYVGYLEQYSVATQKQLSAMMAAGKITPIELSPVEAAGGEIKRPKTERWVRKSLPAAAPITDAPCPDGSLNNLEEQFP